MFKSFTTVACSILLSVSALFGAVESKGVFAPRHITNNLDFGSTNAQIKLERAEKILATLVSNPQDYKLVLSTETAFGGEAVPAGIYGEKPAIIVYQGALAPGRSDEELAFMMAHELGHIYLKHSAKMQAQMEKIFKGGPAEISGTIFSVYCQKFQEREADLFGLQLYKQAGYDMGFFPFTQHLLSINPNIHYGTSCLFPKSRSSLSMLDTHFNMTERFQLLVQEASGNHSTKIA